MMYTKLVSDNGALYAVRCYDGYLGLEETDERLTPLERDRLFHVQGYADWDGAGEAAEEQAQEEIRALEEECPESFRGPEDAEEEAEDLSPYYQVLDAALELCMTYGPRRILAYLTLPSLEEAMET